MNEIVYLLGRHMQFPAKVQKSYAVVQNDQK